MRTIHFKNGEIKLVDQEIVDKLAKNLADGCPQYQSYSNEDGETFLLINIAEITHID